MHHFSWLHFILHSPESKQPCELCQAYVQRHIWTRIIFAYYNCNCAEAFKEIKVTKIVVWPRKKFSDRLNLQEQLTLHSIIKYSLVVIRMFSPNSKNFLQDNRKDLNLLVHKNFLQHKFLFLDPLTKI